MTSKSGQQIITINGGEPSPRPIYKNTKLRTFLDQHSEMFVFIVYVSRGLPFTLKLRRRPLALNFFKKPKEVWN